MVVNQAALKGITTNFNTLFNKVFSEAKPLWPQLATRVPSATAEEAYKWLGDIPGMREWIGDKQIQNLTASDYTIKNRDFELTIGVDRNDIEDDRIGIYAPMMEMMSVSAAQHPDELVFEVLKNGFNKKCYDGKTFYATDHKIGKVTYSNKGTEALTADAYSEARSKMMSIRGENGKSLNIVPNLLVVPPALESVARKILKAEVIDGTSNLLKDTAEILPVPELSDNPTAWYLLCTQRPVRPFIYQERKKAKLVSLTNDTDENVFMQKQFLYSVEARDSAGYAFWQLAYGSTGAGN